MLFLVRHAHSNYSSDEMRGLSESGRNAAHRVANLLEKREISAIVSSPYPRAIETVQALSARVGVSIEIDPDLRERCLSAEPLRDFRRCLEATWLDFELAYPGGESSSVAQNRVSGAIRRIAESAAGRNVVIASHGNALALFLRTLDSQVDFRFWARMSMPDVYAVDVEREVAWSYSRVCADAT